ncbi:MAG: hypothetical protein JNG88_16390 [Phycisphaerales bacterium]|nr:hypothetical protein [Phycisphaerales bacterium]
MQDANGMFEVRDEQLQEHGIGWTTTRKEIERVLFGLGYNVDDPSK